MLQKLTGKTIKAFLAANAPALIAGAVAVLLALLATFQGCAAREVRKQLQVTEAKLEKVDDELTEKSRTVLQQSEQLQLAASQSRQLKEKLSQALKRIQEPALDGAGQPIRNSDGTVAYRTTEESSSDATRDELDVFQLRLQREAQARQEAELLAEQRRQAYVESRAELKQLEQSRPPYRHWTAAMGPTIGAGDGGAWWGTLGYTANIAGLGIGPLISYPLAPIDVFMDGRGLGGGPASKPLNERPFIAQIRVDF